MKGRFAVLLAGLLVLTIGMCACGGGGDGGTPQKANAPTGSDETSSDGITLVAHAMPPCSDNPVFLCTVSGTALNQTGHTIDAAIVKVAFLGEMGQTIAVAIERIESFESGDYRNFSITCPVENCQAPDYAIEVIVEN